jgi:DNA-binding NarL/FixJ family response regulator
MCSTIVLPEAMRSNVIERSVSDVHVLPSATTLDLAEDRDKQMPYARILLADDNTEILKHTSDLLGADYEIIGRVADGNSVCSEVKKLRPDLIVLDISMGACSGIEIARRLQEQGYAGEIVFLTVHEDPEFVRAAIGAGGRGYVIKSRMNVDLGLAIKSALRHRVFISSISLQD